MTMLNWLLLAYGTVCAALAVFYCRDNIRLRADHVWLREALRARDAAGREPERVAFQAGLRVGTRTPMLYTPQDPDEARAEFLRDMIDVSVDCHCAQCTKQRWAVN